MAKVPWGGLHSGRVRYHFRVDVFDFFLQWILGAQTHGGSEVGESFYAASQIEDGNPESWVRSWTGLAERVETRAQTSLSGGHAVSARESYLRAYSYYRAALGFMSPIKEPERYRYQYEKARSCFRKAAELFDPPIEPFEIPFEGKALPGYFLKPDRNDESRKTLIMIGGGDTFVEDLYVHVGPAGKKRGYNVLMVDLPGQGILPFDGLVMRADYEAPMRAVVDYALSRPEVDPERLAAYGISGGGYVVPRAVSYEKRIKAIAVFSMMLDVHETWAHAMGGQALAFAEKYGLLRVAERLNVRKVRTGAVLFDTYRWKYGAKTLLEMLETVKDFVADPAKISCPTLILVGQQEYEDFDASRRWQHEAIEKIANPNKQLIVMPHDEGADSHSGGANLSLNSQLVFDWLDELFERQDVEDVGALSADRDGRASRHRD